MDDAGGGDRWCGGSIATPLYPRLSWSRVRVAGTEHGNISVNARRSWGGIQVIMDPTGHATSHYAGTCYWVWGKGNELP